MAFYKLNILEGNGAVCISVNSRYKAYYANGSYGKKLKMNRIKYESY